MATQHATASPTTDISLADFIEKAQDEQCVIIIGRESFIGDSGTRTGLGYPHLHIWRDGTIALSAAKGRNTKVGKNSVINIGLLGEAAARFILPAGSLRNTIGWVLASAS